MPVDQRRYGHEIDLDRPYPCRVAAIDRLIREALGLYRTPPLRPLVSATLRLLPVGTSRSALVAYELARMQAMSGDESAAMATLVKASDRGLWWAPELMVSEAAFGALSERDAFKEIVRQSTRLRSAARARPRMVVFEPAGEPRAVLLVLHPRNGRAGAFAGHWRDAAGMGYRVVVPDSGQLFGIDTFCWDDIDSSLLQVQESVQANRPQGKEWPIVLAGFSQGAALAIWLALSGQIPARKFLAINPGFATIPPIDSFVSEAHARHVRGRLLVGELDGDLPEASRLSDRLLRAGLDVSLEKVMGLGHDMPRPFRPHLTRMLSELEGAGS